MLIRYRGGRPGLYKVMYNRKPILFTPEDNWTVDIKEQEIRDYIFTLPNNYEFEAIEREPLREVMGKKNNKIEKEVLH